MNKEKEESIGFLKELEEKHGGKISERTFALWAFLPSGQEFSSGMFLYRIDNVFYYEDFDKGDMNILGFTVKRKRDKPFVKTEGSFLSEDVVRVFKTTKNEAKVYYDKKKINSYHTIKVAGVLKQFFKECVYAIELKNGDFLFFQMMDDIVSK